MIKKMYYKLHCSNLQKDLLGYQVLVPGTAGLQVAVAAFHYPQRTGPLVHRAVTDHPFSTFIKNILTLKKLLYLSIQDSSKT